MSSSDPWSDVEYAEVLDGLGPVALRSAISLGIPDLLVTGPKTVSALASALGASPDALRSLLDFLCVRGVFSSSDLGYALNSRSMQLLSTHPSGISAWMRDCGPGALMDDAFRDMTASVTSGEPAFERRHGASFYDVMESERAGRDFTTLRGRHGEVIADALSATGLLDETREILDVGGGDGSFLMHLLDRHESLTGQVLDRSVPIEAARRRAAERGLLPRLVCHAGDFFESVPRAQDTVLLSNVIHNWPDADALRIVGAVAHAVGEDGRVLLIESCTDRLPPRVATAMDMRMFLLCGGKQRDQRDFDRLFAEVGLVRHHHEPLSPELDVMVYGRTSVST